MKYVENISKPKMLEKEKNCLNSLKFIKISRTKLLNKANHYIDFSEEDNKKTE